MGEKEEREANAALAPAPADSPAQEASAGEASASAAGTSPEPSPGQDGASDAVQQTSEAPPAPQLPAGWKFPDGWKLPEGWKWQEGMPFPVPVLQQSVPKQEPEERKVEIREITPPEEPQPEELLEEAGMDVPEALEEEGEPYLEGTLEEEASEGLYATETQIGCFRDSLHKRQGGREIRSTSLISKLKFNIDSNRCCRANNGTAEHIKHIMAVNKDRDIRTGRQRNKPR